MNRSEFSISGRWNVQWWWHKLKDLPGGKWAFSRAMGIIVPYTGTILPFVQSMDNGAATVYFLNKRRVRNHLGSVHAAASLNLIELAANLALLSRPESFRCIVTHLEGTFRRKGVGKWIRATCDTKDLELTRLTTAQVILWDDKLRKVAEGSCTWKIW